jgi:hypothetical protein
MMIIEYRWRQQVRHDDRRIESNSDRGIVYVLEWLALLDFLPIVCKDNSILHIAESHLDSKFMDMICNEKCLQHCGIECLP